MSKKIVLFAKKVGMTRVFDDQGAMIPVTVLEMFSAKVVEKKEIEKHGYEAVILATGEISASKMKKAQTGYAKKHNIGVFKSLYEIRSKSKEVSLPDLGEVLSIKSCSAEATIDITSFSKGKGFQGVVKRWNFATQDNTHGNSVSHRAPGSIGSNQPGRVWKGQKMSGHMGAAQVTLKSCKVVGIELDRSVLLVKGGVPGHNGCKVLVSQEV